MLKKKMAKASASFGRLRQRLWNSHHPTTNVKGKIYQAVVTSTLLHGTEILGSVRTSCEEALCLYHTAFRSILKITWKDKVTNKEILDKILCDLK